jgi:hypothetical protein
VNRPTVAQAQDWRPEALRQTGRRWDAMARRLRADSASFAAATHMQAWEGASADAADSHAGEVTARADAAARALSAASATAGHGADQLAAARGDVLDAVDEARGEGFAVADDGSLTGPDPFGRAVPLHARIVAALDRLAVADRDTAAGLTAALGGDVRLDPAPTVPAGDPGDALRRIVEAWPTMSQDSIAAQLAALPAEQRDRLVSDFPGRVGNTDGVPWPLRMAANRINIATALLAESGRDDGSRRRIDLYRQLLDEVDDPAHPGARIPRQILGFDPARSSLIELHGDLASARSVAVLVPGVNTTVEGSANNAATARRFVAGSHGDVAMITYLGGPFPQVHDPLAVVLDAADPHSALEMAPRLVAFSEDVERTVAPGVPVTVIGHSYGGSIVGTAEVFGLTSDRTLFLAAAGSGVGVDDPSDWHNRNPDVLRFSMTAPGDFIEAVQGIPGGPHGADPDEMPGVIRLGTGDYDDGRPVAGWGAHSGMLNRPSDSWRTILAVITGDGDALRRAVIAIPR